MVKYTQTIRRQLADELFEGILPFHRVGAERVKVKKDQRFIVKYY